MTVHILKSRDGPIWLLARAADAGTVGDLSIMLIPGSAAFDRPYDWWASQTTPTVEID